MLADAAGIQPVYTHVADKRWALLAKGPFTNLALSRHQSCARKYKTGCRHWKTRPKANMMNVGEN